ncbi:MAG: hypothetical protein ACFFF4_18210, partial [Candidatus Thorarchaeota archaeon]
RPLTCSLSESARFLLFSYYFDYFNLGYESVDILANTHNLDGVKRLERLAKNHPYTIYRSRCFGSHNGLFLQFRTPIGTRSLIEKVIETLQEEDIVESYNILSEYGDPTINSVMQLDNWDPETMSWKFDWIKWFETEQKAVNPKKPKGKPGSALEWLTTKDMYILQQLMLGAKRSNADIIRAIEKKGVTITPHTFGRHLKMIDEVCVSEYTVEFNPLAFDIITNILITGKGKRKYLRSLYSKMSGKPIPFESTMRVTDSDLFWFVRMPSSHLSSLLTNLHANLDNMTVTIIDYNESFVYSIWPDTLDEENHRWRTDRKFMIDQALK